MLRRTSWPAIAAVSIPAALAGIALRAESSVGPRALTADEVIELWKPPLQLQKDYHHLGGSRDEAPSVAAYSFRIEGPSFEVLWNHYADLCGVRERYESGTFQNGCKAADKGIYAIGSRISLAAPGKRGLSVFLLKTERYTVTVTIQPDPDGKAIQGSISAVIL